MSCFHVDSTKIGNAMYIGLYITRLIYLLSPWPNFSLTTEYVIHALHNDL